MNNLFLYLSPYFSSLLLFLCHTFPSIFSGSVASLLQHVTPPLRQNPAVRCDIEAAQEKPPCLKHRGAFWSPVPPPWTPFPIPLPRPLSHSPPHSFSQSHPTSRPPCTCEEQATQPWLPAGTSLPSPRRDEPTEAPAAESWKWWSDGF